MSFSVVVPTYNRGTLLQETISRIIGQTLPPLEIIVVDDGSTDESHAALAKHGDQIRVITIPNSGELVARNTGLLAAVGDFVAFCDSDDLWFPDHLESMAAFWQTGKGPLCAYSDFCEVRDGQWGRISKFDTAPAGYWVGLVPAEGGEVFPQPIVSALLQFQPFFPSCMVVDRKRFMMRGGWDDGVSRIVGCDFATTLRIAEHPPIGVMRRPTVGIRKHPGNFSSDVLRMNLGDADVLARIMHEGRRA